MKRILLVEANEDGTIGGSHKVLGDLVTRMSEPYRPLVVFYQDNPWTQRLRDAGIEVHTWDDRRAQERAILSAGGSAATLRGLASSIRWRANFLREQRISLVLLNNSHRFGLDEWVPATRLAGIPCAAYSMGLPEREPVAWRRFLIRRLHRIFPVSELMKRGVLTNGYPESRTTLAYPGLDLEEMDSRDYRSRDEVREEFGLAEGRLLVIMTGNLRHWKGQHVVVEGLGCLSPEDRTRLKLVFAGDFIGHEEYADGLKRRVEELGLEDVVVFAGWREDVPDLLEAADIAVHSSVIPEPFGLVVAEGMLHGCATVAANTGGPVEQIEPGTSGLTFDTERPQELADHLSRLARDDEYRERMAAVGRKEARVFDVARHVAIMEKAFSELI